MGQCWTRSPGHGSGLFSDQANGSEPERRKTKETGSRVMPTRLAVITPWIMMGSLVQTTRPLETHVLMTGNPEIHHHKGR